MTEIKRDQIKDIFEEEAEQAVLKISEFFDQSIKLFNDHGIKPERAELMSLVKIMNDHFISTVKSRVEFEI